MASCIMPEQPYCPCCRYGYLFYPEWVESYDDTLGILGYSEWHCLLIDDKGLVDDGLLCD